jgi:hypothetical protein
LIEEETMTMKTGIFVYDPKNMYLAKDAIKVYKIEKAAEKACDKMNEAEGYARNLVTRRMYCTD